MAVKGAALVHTTVFMQHCKNLFLGRRASLSTSIIWTEM